MMYRKTERRLRTGGWAVQIAGFSIVLILVAIILHRLVGLATPVALNLFSLSFAGAGLATLMALVTLWRVWRSGFHGAGSAIVAIVLALTIFMWPLALLPQINALPNINDVSTDVVRPPKFVEIANKRSAGSNSLAYPGEAFAKQQTRAYPDLRTMSVERDAAETTSLVAQALKRLRMEVVSEDPPERSTGYIGHVEAVDRTLVFGFYDDVVVRVRSNGRGSLVDIRSASRYGSHDLGRNAERVRKVMTALVDRIQATVPKQNTTRRGRRLKKKRPSAKSR